MGQVLVLNASYEPLNITSWRRAMVMMIKGKAESLEQDTTREIRRGTHLPTVIRLRHYVHVPFRQLPLTRRNLYQRDHHTCQIAVLAISPFLSTRRTAKSRWADTWDNVTTACLTCNVRKGNERRRKRDAVDRPPHRPLSSLSFEATRQIHSGQHGMGQVRDRL